jgi:predicted ATPase
MTLLGEKLTSSLFYREWNMGRNSVVRKPVRTNEPGDFLLEDFSNLALVVNKLQLTRTIATIEEMLRRFSQSYERVQVQIDGGTALLMIREKGLDVPTPATRLSDGTLRFLALLTILCHPEPPPLICIEEPELGLHPDIIPIVAELLRSASERTQLVVTTHSKRLIDEFSDELESVVVCERDPEEGTQFQRLSKDRLGVWLERYELGELWEKGEIGGNRW